MLKIQEYILRQAAEKKIDRDTAKALLLELKGHKKPEKDIAIIGVASYFPDSENNEKFWENLMKGKNCIGDLPSGRLGSIEYYYKNIYRALYPVKKIERDENNSFIFEKQGYFSQIDHFDAAFFGISPREARAIDPIHRIFLEIAYHVFEDAGYGGKKIYGSNTGVYVGRNHTKSQSFDRMVNIDPLGITGTWSGILSSRISYLFDLKGPSVVIDTACSSGLVAVHQAVKAIREGECRQAIAGGVSGIQFLPIKGLHTALATYESSDGLVKTFDHRADGTVWSEGAGAVMLKSLKDALKDNDRIYAVIKGSAINNDGKSNGITAPNALAQEDMLINAWKDARVDPGDISYIEAHGTGTALGDPIEIKALTNAFRRYTNKKQFCAIGSLKSNMGHLVGASGLAGLIKVVLSLKNKQIPGTINFERPNEFINFTDSPLYIAAENLKWESGNKKRIAAINSFGFSGTNCHMVVEEPPAIPEQQQGDKSSTAAYAFVLSARNDTSFEQLITLSINTLRRGNARIKDICYTAATGRGHYEIRAVVIAYSREDLISKLVLLDKSGYKTHCDDWFFFGSHKIVPDDKKVKGRGEITEKEKKSLNTDAVICTRDLAKMPLFPIGKISVLCNYYIKGADIQWDTLYTGKTVELPPYPYKREYYWPEPDMSDWGENLNRENAEIIHPLVEKLVIESIEQDIYSTRFYRDKHWQLSEHLVLGTNALPGTTFVEIIKIISQQYWGECPVEINNFVFYTPVAVDNTNEGQEVQYIVKNNENHLDFLAISKTGSQWQRHAAGIISPMQETNNTHTLDLEKLINRCKPRENKDNTQNFTFGLRWRCVRDMYVGDNEFVHKITLRDEVDSDLEVYYLHPALLDQCVNCFSQDIYPGNMYLPYMYKNLKVYGPFPKTFYTHTLVKKSREETISFDFLVSDESGKVFLEINDYTIKKVHKKEFREKTGIGMKNNSFYKMNWNLLNRKPDNNSSGNCIALFHRETKRSMAIKEALLNSGKEIIEVILSNTYKRLGEKKYTIDGSENSYHSLFKEIDRNSLTDIVHMFSEEEEDVSIEDTLSAGIYSLFYMIKALAANKFNKKLNLVVITDEAHVVTGNEASIKPSHKALEGICKSIELEHTNLKVRVINVDKDTNNEIILQEMFFMNEFSIALRQGSVYKEILDSIDPESLEDRELTFKKDGVYLVTGGTGGLALESASYLAKQGTVSIALISRSKMNSTDKADPKMLKVIETMDQVRRTGSNINYYSADVTDKEIMTTLIQDLKKEFGAINGILHCAGAAGEGFLMNKESAVFDKVIKPKIIGTVLLDKLTEDQDLDFFVFYSSITSLFSGMGQGDYTAANSFMDAYSVMLNRKGRAALSINWAPWKETGMAVEYGVASGDSAYVYGLENEEALNMLGVMLRKKLPGVMGGRLNTYVITERGSLLDFSQSITREINRTKTISTEKKKKETNPDLENIVMTGTEGKDLDKIEIKMAKLWAKALGLKEINVYDDFTSLGGDSILAIELLKELEKGFPGIVDITDIYSYPSVSLMAEFVQKQTGGSANEEQKNITGDDDARLKNMLDDLENDEKSIDDILEEIL